MPTHPHLSDEATTDGLPIAPSLGVSLENIEAERQPTLMDRGSLMVCAIAVGLGFLAALVARFLTALINLVTHIAFYGEISFAPVSPADHHAGWLVFVIPAIGGLIVGLMARHGSQAIRGHGIPEAMEQVLRNQSRIPARITLLKPLSSAVAIGTGGPFGAEGPIIATGGALGSLIGQVLRTTAAERKTLLAAGAAAGMSAIFGSPVAAVVLAVELLLFEFRPRSVIPVALACVTAAGVRYATIGADPVFAMPDLARPGGEAILFYVLLGACAGLLAVAVTRLVYAIEDAFDHLPIHWMWWPALGGLVVGAVGYFEPNTLGVGYDNIERIISGQLVGSALVFLCVMKLISWSIALGSGTSGGTLAPLFTIGGGFGAAIGALAVVLLPQAGIDIRIAGLVGMAAIFAGASRALLASVIFAFETTQQPLGLLPLLGGCAAAYLVSCLLMKHTIMTEKIARRGTRVPTEYAADFLEQLNVGAVATREVVTLKVNDTLGTVRAWLHSGAHDAQHQGYPVQDGHGQVLGVVTRRDVFDPAHADTAALGETLKRSLLTVRSDQSLRAAADRMVAAGVGRLVVVTDDGAPRMCGIITRGDLLDAHAQRLHESEHRARTLVPASGAAG